MFKLLSPSGMFALSVEASACSQALKILYK